MVTRKEEREEGERGKRADVCGDGHDQTLDGGQDAAHTETEI